MKIVDILKQTCQYYILVKSIFKYYSKIDITMEELIKELK